MARTLAIITMAFTGLATSYAGSLGINPGDYLNPDGTVSVGLLPNTGTPGANTGLVSNPDGITGTNFTQTNYTSSSMILYGSQVTTLPQSNVTCGTQNCQGGQTAVTPTAGSATIYSPASAPEFDLLGDATYADRIKNSNAWISTSSGTGTGSATITIPVGIFGVTSVDTVLNTIGGVMTGGTVCAGATTTQAAATNCTNTASYGYITLEFNSSDSTGQTGTDVYETIALVNGVTQENILDGTCVNGNGGYCSGTGTLSNSVSSASITDPNTSAAYTVQAGVLFSGTVSANTHGSLGAANGATMVLDDQIFPVFSEYANDYLVNVSITNTGAGSGANYSEELLSGLTVAAASEPSLFLTVATPEPSSVLLALAGLGVMSCVRLRRKRA